MKPAADIPTIATHFGKVTPTVAIDTREQTPWRFTLPTTSATLDAGDYSIIGLEALVAVERKSLPDLLTCIGRDRGRFTRELQRLRAYRFRMLVVEATLADIEAGDWSGRSKVHPNAVAGSLASWAAEYGLPVIFAGDHEAAGRFAERFLVHAVRSIAKAAQAIAGMVPTVEGAA